MKKLLIALLASLVSLNAFAVTYDFSSEDAFEASMKAQAKAEGVEEEDLDQLMELYVGVLAMQNIKEIEALGDDADAALALILKLLEKDIQGKTIVEIATQLETMSDKIEAMIKAVEAMEGAALGTKAPEAK